MQRFAPKYILTSIIDDWAPYYVERSIAARDGTWKQQDTWHGLKEGMVAMAPYNSAMGDDLVKEVEQLQKDLASGKAHSFTGPIYDQKGNILVAEGAVADDGMLAGMNVYVKGVEGDIPQ